MHRNDTHALREISRCAGSARVLLLIILVGLLATAGHFLNERVQERRARREQQAAEIKAVVNEMRSTAAEEIKKDGYSAESGIAALDKLRAIADKNSKGNDTDAKLMAVMSRYLGKIGEEGKALVAISNKLIELEAFDLSSHKTKEAIAERRKLAQELIAKNRTFMACFTQGSSYVRDELKRAGIGDSAAESHVRSFEAGQQRQLPAVKKVRQGDIAIAGVLIELCDLSEAELGKFEAGKGGKVLFENPAAAGKFNALLERLVAAEAEQKKAQESLFANSKK